ncbi:hypothetical protein FOMPIDRAFT_1020356 [Fomitopsis schrenkii]|uniref:Uncharacterized protein n=1 Tax=Fomitopsis schrenkii TaxID=2126942 RepID=S8DMN5_FOMSC|nr:hypothetical protein FOMPIDRAFT_1020356 [Fomitopsis schrenkii]
MVTEQYIQQQLALRQQRERDVQCREARCQAQQNVKVFVWVTEGSDPELYELQDELVWPHLKLTPKVLQELGFLALGDLGPCRLKMYMKELGVWSIVKQDQVFTVVEEECIFLKGLSVTDPPNFSRLLSTAKRTNGPHLHKNIAYE